MKKVLSRVCFRSPFVGVALREVKALPAGIKPVMSDDVVPHTAAASGSCNGAMLTELHLMFGTVFVLAAHAKQLQTDPHISTVMLEAFS
jgi:hypothetical protein